MAAPAPTRRVGAIEVPVSAVRTKAVARKAEVAVAAPTDNPLYKILFSESLNIEEKRAAIAKHLAATLAKADNKAEVEEFYKLQAWLEEEFQRMQKEILHLTDTEAFSVLQSVYNDMNGALVEFDETMRPLTDVLDALYALNTADKTFDAYVEIKGDERAEAERATKRTAAEARLNAVRDRVNAAGERIAVLGEDKSWFGYGNVKKRSREEIALKERELIGARADLDAIAAEITALSNAPERESALGDLAVHKGELAKLLNITGDHWKEQQTKLVNAALGFITKSKNRITDVEKHLGMMTEQVDALYDTNSRMGQVYALVGDGVSDAVKATADTRSSVVAPTDGESMTVQIERNQRLVTLDEHAKALDDASRSCATGFAETTSEEVRLRTMRESNRDKMSRARVMATQGTSGMAGRLAVVVNAVSDAALGQSEDGLRDTLIKMGDRTNVVAQKQVIAQSLGAQQTAAELERTIKGLGEMREVVQASRQLMEEGVAAVREHVDTLTGLAEGLKADSGEAIAVYADKPKAVEPEKAL